MCVKRFMHMLYGICRHAVAGVVAHLKKKKKKQRSQGRNDKMILLKCFFKSCFIYGPVCTLPPLGLANHKQRMITTKWNQQNRSLHYPNFGYCANVYACNSCVWGGICNLWPQVCGGSQIQSSVEKLFTVYKGYIQWNVNKNCAAHISTTWYVVSKRGQVWVRYAWSFACI